MWRIKQTVVSLCVAGLVLSFLVVTSALAPGNSSAVSYSPTVFYDFSGTATDDNNNSTLTFVPACTGSANPCNLTSGYGSDVKGTYWTWTAKASSTRGGGFVIDTAASVGTTFSVAFRISFKETSCYRTIIDFSDGVDDNHLYFCNGLEFYPQGVSNAVFAPNTVYDILISRLSNGTIRAYKLNASGQAELLLEVADLPSPSRSIMIPAVTPSGGSRLRFFHDECCEYTTEGKVYDVRIWANQVLPPEQFTAAGATPTTTTSTSTTTTSTTTTTTSIPATTTSATAAPVPASASPTTAAPALDIVVNAPTTTVVTGGTTATVQSRSTTVPVVSTPNKSTSATSSTVSAVTTTSTIPPNSGGTVAPKPPAPPTVVAGGASVKVGDSLEEPKIERRDNQLVVTAGPLKATVGGLNSDGSVMALDSDGSVRLRMGDKVRIKLAGFKPGSTMEAWLFSTPVLLGTTKVGADGTVTATFLVPRGTAPGPHRIVVSTRTADDKPATLAVGVNVGEWKKESSLTMWLIVLTIALAIAAALVLPATRRKSKSTV